MRASVCIEPAIALHVLLIADHLKTHRLLQELKQRRVAPNRHWDVSSIIGDGMSYCCCWLYSYGTPE